MYVLGSRHYPSSLSELRRGPLRGVKRPERHSLALYSNYMLCAEKLGYIYNLLMCTNRMTSARGMRNPVHCIGKITREIYLTYYRLKFRNPSFYRFIGCTAL